MNHELDEIVYCVNQINKKLSILCRDNKNIELLYEFDSIITPFNENDTTNRLPLMRNFIDKLNKLVKT